MAVEPADATAVAVATPQAPLRAPASDFPDSDPDPADSDAAAVLAPVSAPEREPAPLPARRSVGPDVSVMPQPESVEYFPGDDTVDDESGAHDVPSRTTREPRTPRARLARTSRSRKPTMSAFIVAGALVACATAGVLVWSPWNTPTPVVAASAADIAAAAPLGWAAEAAWQTPAQVASNVAVADEHVVFMNSEGVLVVLDAATGKTVDSSLPTGVDPASANIRITRAGDEDVVVVIHSGAILVWPLSEVSGDPTTNMVPSTATVSAAGGGLLMSAGGEAWVLNDAFGMTPTLIPEGYVPLAATAEGAVISGSARGGWAVSTEEGSETVAAELPEEGVGEAIYPARAARGLIAAWAPTEDKTIRAVAVYDATSGEKIVESTLPTDVVNLGLPFNVSRDGTQAAVANWLIDLEAGDSVTADPSWQTRIVTRMVTFGTVGDEAFAWTAGASLASMDEDAVMPWGVTADGHAIVVTSSETGSVVSALTAATTE